MKAEQPIRKEPSMPTSLLDRVRAALKRPSPTIPQLADALADARRADLDARAAVDKAQAVVAAGFLDAADKRQADRDALAKAREAAEDAGLVLAEVERRHVASVDADEQDRRRALYDGARAQADKAAMDLSRTYPRLAAGLVAMLKDLAMAQAAVAEANATLPDGATPLEDPEFSARSIPGLPREVVSDEWIEAWARLDMNEPAADQAAIYDCGNGWGKRPGDAQAAFRMRRFRKVVTREPVNGDYPLPLAAALQLPAVKGSKMLWGDSHSAHAPGLSMMLFGAAEPQNVLARVAEIDAAATARPVKVERAVKTEWPKNVDVVPLPDGPAYDRRAGQPSGTGSRFGASPFARPGARAGGRR